jgi:ribokinase
MKLLVLGNAGWDLLCPVPHLPRPGETLVTQAHTRAPGGKGLNQAVIAARAGANVTLAAPIGPDAADLAAILAHETLIFEPHPVPLPTDQSLLMVTPDGENAILSVGACADALTETEARTIADRLTPGDWLLLQGNLSSAATRAAMHQAKARGASIMFNPAPLRWNTTDLLPLCDVVVANAVEALEITGTTGPQAAAALHAAGASLAIVTLGAEGCAIADHTGVRLHQAIPVKVIDTTGAGDTVCGVLAARLMTGTPPDTAILEAMRAASLTVQRPGAFAALPDAAALCAPARYA